MRKYSLLIALMLALFACVSHAQTPEDIVQFMQAGQKAYNQGDLAAAALEFENVLIIDQANFSAKVWLVQVFADLKDFNKARQLLREASLQAPDHPRVVQLHRLLGETTERQVRIEKDPVTNELLSSIGVNTSLRPYGMVIPQDKVNPPKNELDFLVFDDLKIAPEPDMEDDIIAFAMPASPLADVFDALAIKGVSAALDIYFDKLLDDPSIAAVSDEGLLQRGRDLYEPRLETAPNDQEAKYYMGLLALVDGMYQDSADLLEPFRQEVGEREPTLKRAFVIIDKWKSNEEARALAKKQAEEERIAQEAAEAEEARRREMQEAAARQRAASRAEGGDSDDAPAASEEAQAKHDAGYDFYKRGNLDEAIANFQQAIEIDDTNPQYHYHYGLAWTDKGLAGDMSAFDIAITSFQYVISLTPGSKTATDAESMIRDIESARQVMGD